jgi:Mg2+ and Co2+ transporter CorA
MNTGVPWEGNIAGFWVIVGVMIGMLGGMIAYFRHRNWL